MLCFETEDLTQQKQENFDKTGPESGFDLEPSFQAIKRTLPLRLSSVNKFWALLWPQIRY